MEQEQLLFAISPICPLAAEVVIHETTIYFYLYDLDFEEESLVTRCACWVKNLMKAPSHMDLEAMEEGNPILLSQEYISEDMDITKLRQDDLEIEWSKEGNIASLYHKDILICVLPSYAVPMHSPGFSRYCKENNALAWKLSEESELHERLQEGREFWAQDFQESWMLYSSNYLQDLEQHFGEAKQCYRVNQDQFPTFFLMLYEKAGICYAFSAGMGMFPMPNTEQYFEHYEQVNRCEIAFAWQQDCVEKEEIDEILAQMSGLMNFPWQRMDYIGHGHTIDFHIHSNVYAMFVKNKNLDTKLTFAIEPDISLNWLVPIDELQFNEMQKSKSNAKLMLAIQENQRYIYKRRQGKDV